MVEVIAKVLGIIAYLALGLTAYMYLVLWLRNKPEEIAASVSSGPRTQALVTALGNAVFFFVALLSVCLVVVGFWLVGWWFFGDAFNSR